MAKSQQGNQSLQGQQFRLQPDQSGEIETKLHWPIEDSSRHHIEPNLARIVADQEMFRARRIAQHQDRQTDPFEIKVQKLAWNRRHRVHGNNRRVAVSPPGDKVRLHRPTRFRREKVTPKAPSYPREKA
jgi:hypothetical protein